MNTQAILDQADALFAAGQAPQAASLLEDALAGAGAAGDWGARLTFINELMGYYRSTSRMEQAWAYAEQARKILEEHSLSGSLAGVTTLLNIATVYRADRRPAEALELYAEVEQVYLAAGLQGDYRLGGLYNNMAVSALEAGRTEDAVSYGRRAVAALDGAEGVAGERATALSNLAAALLWNKEEEAAEACLEQALTLFEHEAAGDPHYGGALSARAYLAFRRGEEEQALTLYRRAMEVTRRAFGENRDYQRLAANVRALEQRKEQRD